MRHTLTQQHGVRCLLSGGVVKTRGRNGGLSAFVGVITSAHEVEGLEGVVTAPPQRAFISVSTHHAMLKNAFATAKLIQHLLDGLRAPKQLLRGFSTLTVMPKWAQTCTMRYVAR